MDPEPTPLVDMVLVSWTCLLVELLTSGIVLGCCLGRRLRRCWREVREGVRQAGQGGPRGCSASWAALWPRPRGRGGLSPGDSTRQRWPELFFLQPLPGAAQPGPSLSRRGQGQRQRAQPRSAPLPLPWGSLGRAVQEKRRSPWGCAGRAAGTWLPQGAAAAAEAQPRPDAAVPAPPLSAEAQSQDTSKRGQLQEEETPRLPSALTLQLQLGAQLAGHRGGCVTSAQPGHCDIPQLRGQ